MEDSQPTTGRQCEAAGWAQMEMKESNEICTIVESVALDTCDPDSESTVSVGGDPHGPRSHTLSFRKRASNPDIKDRRSSTQSTSSGTSTEKSARNSDIFSGRNSGIFGSLAKKCASFMEAKPSPTPASRKTGVATVDMTQLLSGSSSRTRWDSVWDVSRQGTTHSSSSQIHVSRLDRLRTEVKVPLTYANSVQPLLPDETFLPEPYC